MATYKERFATFTFTSSSISWPHVPPTPQPIDLTATEFEYVGIRTSPDKVRCTKCCHILGDWKPDNNPLQEYLRFSPRCPRAKEIAVKAQKTEQEVAAKKAQNSIPNPQDIGFFDPSLQQDFPELRLFSFLKQVKEYIDQYREMDVLQLLFNCRRVSTFT